MFNTSQDIFYIILSFGILWVALALGWVLWYVGRILREFFVVMREIRGKIEKIDATIDLFRKKIENSSYHLTLLAEGVKKLLEVYHRRAKKRKTSDSE